MSYERIVISSGHGKYIRGASGSPVPPQLDEVDEARCVVEKVADELEARGVKVVTFHDDTSHDQNTNLSTIVAAHNREERQLDVSCHFNAYNGTAHGTEVCWVSQEELAGDLAEAISNAGGFTNRGPKYRSDLYFLNQTEMPSVLLEVCFCDNTGDCNQYRANFDAICSAIANVLGGRKDEETAPPDPPTNPGETPKVDITIEASGDVEVFVNGRPVR